MVLSYSVGAVPGDKPFEAFGKDSGRVAQKAEARDDGPTGPATSKSTHEFAETVRSAPGRDLRMPRFIRILAGLARSGDHGSGAPVQARQTGSWFRCWNTALLRNPLNLQKVLGLRVPGLNFIPKPFVPARGR